MSNRRLPALLLLALGAVLLGAAPTPKGRPTPSPVTDANVAERVAGAKSRADHEALYTYYKAKAAAEEPRIAHFENLFRTYMTMEGRWAEPMQRHARALLKAARLSKQRYDLLAMTHRNLAWEEYERIGTPATQPRRPTPPQR